MTEMPLLPNNWPDKLRLDQKRLALLLSIAALILFPDVVILVVFNVLHFAKSWLILLFEHALQEAFDLTRHTSQMITAWVEVAILVGFNVWLFRKLNARFQQWYLRKFQRPQS
ncbi:MAG: hypothetical protein ACKN9W_15610 [Methylococcus sp.]